MSLLTKFGPADFSMYYSGGLFQYNNQLMQVVEPVGSEHVMCVVLSNGNRQVNLPAEVFSSMDFFAYPRLGWRQVLDGKAAVYYYRNHAYKRALTNEHVGVVYDPVTALMLENGVITGNVRNASAIAKAVFQPTYYSLPEALARIRSGDSVSVALNADFCIAPDPDGQKLAVYCKEDKIGTMAADGTGITINSKLHPSWNKVVGNG